MFIRGYTFPSLVSCQLSIMMGAAAGYTAVLISQLRASYKPAITNVEISWIASLILICRPLGVLVEGFIVDRFGRKTTMQIATFLFVISWLSTALSDNLSMVYASRMFTGFSLGMVICVGLYIAEITTPADRGTYLSMITPSTNLGVLLIYFLGSIFSWNTVAFILATYSMAILFCLRYIPESPIWYMLRHRKTEATLVLLKFRNNDTERVEREIDEIRKRLRMHESSAPFAYLRNFASPSAWKPLVIYTVFSFLQQQAGYNIIIYYAMDFFADLGDNLSPERVNMLAIIFASISLVGSLLLVFIVHKFNRITLLVFSGICMFITIGLAALIKAYGGSVPELQPLPIVLVYAYIFVCMLGMIDIPWMMLGEILPNHMRGVLSALITVIIFFLSSINVKLYKTMVAYLGTPGMLCSFGVFSLLSVLFAKKFFPETRNKALFEVEEYFQKTATIWKEEI